MYMNPTIINRNIHLTRGQRNQLIIHLAMRFIGPQHHYMVLQLIVRNLALIIQRGHQDRQLQVREVLVVNKKALQPIQMIVKNLFAVLTMVRDLISNMTSRVAKELYGIHRLKLVIIIGLLNNQIVVVPLHQDQAVKVIIKIKIPQRSLIKLRDLLQLVILLIHLHLLILQLLVRPRVSQVILRPRLFIYHRVNRHHSQHSNRHRLPSLLRHLITTLDKEVRQEHRLVLKKVSSEILIVAPSFIVVYKLINR